MINNPAIGYPYGHGKPWDKPLNGDYRSPGLPLTIRGEFGHIPGSLSVLKYYGYYGLGIAENL